MGDERNEILNSSFFASSFFLICFLFQECLSLLKKKTGIQFKIYHYNSLGYIIIICCTLLHTYFIFYKNEFYASFTFVISFITACFIVGIKQVSDYSKADINACLKDNEGIGAYWAQQTYDAHYKIALEDIKDRMSSFEKEHNIQLSSKKLIIVLPLSCDTECTLTEKDDTINDFGTLEPVENDAGANVNRSLKNPVYKISSTEDVYIVAEFSGLATLWKIRLEMAKEKRDYIRDCYIKTLKNLLLGSPSIVVLYDDLGKTSESLSSCLLSVIEKERKEKKLII